MIEGSDGQDRRPAPRLKYFVFAVVGIFVLQIVYAVIVFNSFAPMDERGQFGDLFGGLNALFTGLAFAGLIYTILLQRRELELQRGELRLTREELRASAEAQADQVTQLKVSADLSALTALVNVYGTLLQPHWDSIRQLQVELAHAKSTESKSLISLADRNDATQQRRMLENELREQSRAWSTTLRRHEKLIERLEALVERTDETN